MRTLILILAIINTYILQAQPDCYKKFMPMTDELDMLSLPDDSISPLKTYRGELDVSGYTPGKRILNFELKTTYGRSVDLIDQQRPKLLITGSYTCYVFRNKVKMIDSLYGRYKDKIDVYVVYVVEAHPDVDKCPYRDSIWVTDQNRRDGVLYSQPVTYQQRVALASTMQQQMNIQTPILVDNSNNDYWMHFGPAPNNAYLVDKDGRVLAKNTWLDKTMKNAIDRFLSDEAAK